MTRRIHSCLVKRKFFLFTGSQGIICTKRAGTALKVVTGVRCCTAGIDINIKMASLKCQVLLDTLTFFFFLVGYVEERLWWPIQSPNKGRKKKASS